jgi:uncharacterized integral membrane protein
VADKDQHAFVSSLISDYSRLECEAAMLGALGVILALILALAVGYFSLMNQTPVTVQLWPGMAPRTAFVWEIALYAAMAGWLISSLFWLAPLFGGHRRHRQLRRRLRELEAKLIPPSVVAEPAPSALENRAVVNAGSPERVVAARADEEPV